VFLVTVKKDYNME